MGKLCQRITFLLVYALLTEYGYYILNPSRQRGTKFLKEKVNKKKNVVNDRRVS